LDVGEGILGFQNTKRETPPAMSVPKNILTREAFEAQKAQRKREEEEKDRLLAQWDRMTTDLKAQSLLLKYYNEHPDPAEKDILEISDSLINRICQHEVELSNSSMKKIMDYFTPNDWP
jgi:hypothetical protein